MIINFGSFIVVSLVLFDRKGTKNRKKMAIIHRFSLSLQTNKRGYAHIRRNQIFGHEVAPRTQHLMTDGPYRLNRNPMLTGTLVYLIGFALWLFTWQAVIIWLLFFIIMFVQVLSEEHRLHRDFGNEYDAYCRHTRRF